MNRMEDKKRLAAIKQNARKRTGRGKKWDFVAVNKDLFSKQEFKNNQDIIALFDRQYKQYSDVPKVDEIFNAITARNKWRKSLIEQRKSKHKIQSNPIKKTLIQSVVHKAMSSRRSSIQQRDKSMTNLIKTHGIDLSKLGQDDGASFSSKFQVFLSRISIFWSSCNIIRNSNGYCAMNE